MGAIWLPRDTYRRATADTWAADQERKVRALEADQWEADTLARLAEQRAGERSPTQGLSAPAPDATVFGASPSAPTPPRQQDPDPDEWERNTLQRLGLADAAGSVGLSAPATTAPEPPGVTTSALSAASGTPSPSAPTEPDFGGVPQTQATSPRPVASVADTAGGMGTTTNRFSPYDDVFRRHAGDLANNDEFLAIVAAGTKAESGWNTMSRTGDGGKSWGLFQIHQVHVRPGEDGSWRNDPDAASAYMLPRYAAAYKQVKARNPDLRGPELASLVAATAERPFQWANPNSAARRHYASAFSEITGQGHTPPPPVASVPTSTLDQTPRERGYGNVAEAMGATAAEARDTFVQPEDRPTEDRQAPPSPLDEATRVVDAVRKAVEPVIGSAIEDAVQRVLGGARAVGETVKPVTEPVGQAVGTALQVARDVSPTSILARTGAGLSQLRQDSPLAQRSIALQDEWRFATDPAEKARIGAELATIEEELSKTTEGKTQEDIYAAAERNPALALGETAMGLGAAGAATALAPSLLGPVKSAADIGRRALATGMDPGGAAIQGAVEAGGKALGAATRAGRTPPGAPLSGIIEQAPAEVRPTGRGVDMPTQSTRMYHGTGAAFETPDAARFDPNGLFGPGYYLTDDARVAGSYADQRGAQVARAELAPDELQRELDSAREALQRSPNDAYLRQYVDDLERQIASGSGGPNIRPVDVPGDLRLLRSDQVVAPAELRAVERVLQRADPDLLESFRTEIPFPNETTGSHVWSAVNLATHDATETNRLLAQAGFEGVYYKGGELVPMMDDAGQPIKHDVAVVFESGMPKLRNALSGTMGGLVDDATANAARTVPPPSAGVDEATRRLREEAGGFRANNPNLRPMRGAVPVGEAVGGGALAGYEESQREGATPQSVLGRSALGAAGNVALGAATRAIPGAGRAVARAGGVVARAVDPESVRRASEDADKIVAEREAVAKGTLGREIPDPVVRNTLNNMATLAHEWTDRRAKIKTIEESLEKQGGPLAFEEKVWIRSRVYEGRQDAALARLEREVGPALRGVPKEDRVHLESFLEQMDNIDKGERAAQKAEARIMGQELGPIKGTANLRQAESRVRFYEQQAAKLATDLSNLEAAKAAEGKLASARRQQARASAKVEAARKDLETQRAMSATVEGERVRAERKFSGGARMQEEDAVRAAWEQRLGADRARAVFDAADAIWHTTRGIRHRLRDSGVFNQEQVEFFEANFPHYLRTHILDKMDDKAIDSLPPGGRLFSVGSNGVKELTEQGTEKARRSPLSSLVDMAFQAENLARKNDIMRRFVGWMDKPDMDHFIRPLKDNEAAPKGWTAMSYFDDGVKARVAVVDELAPALELATPPMNAMLAVGLAAARLPLQLGATVLRPSFIAFNAVNDAIWSLYRFAVEAPDPVEAMRGVTDLLRGYRAAFSSDLKGQLSASAIGAVGGATQGETTEDRLRNAAIGAGLGFGGTKALGMKYGDADRALIQRAREAGGSIGMRSRFSDPDLIVRQLQGDYVPVRQIRNTGDLRQILADSWGKTTDAVGFLWGRPLAEIGGRVEDAPRLAAFSRAERQGKNPTEAAFAKRVQTVDFKAGGRTAKMLNLAVPFFNPSTQAAVEFAATTRKHPVQSVAALSALSSLIVASEVHNRAISQEDNANVSRYVKDTGVFILSDKDPSEGEKRGTFFLPLRGGVGALVPLVREAMGRYFGDDPRTWQELATRLFLTFSPVEPDVSSMVLPVAQPFLEAKTNYDLFRQRPIEPRSMQTLSPEERYTERTSQTARHIAQANLPFLGDSPMKVEHTLRGISPGPVEAFFDAADTIIAATGSALPSRFEAKPGDTRDVPFVGDIAGRFVRTVGQEQTARAYENADRIADAKRPALLEVVRNSPSYQQATPDRKETMLRAAEQEILEQAKIMAGVPEGEPRDLGLPNKYIGVTDPARQREIDEAIREVDEWQQRRLRPPVPSPSARRLALQYEKRINPRYTQATRQQREEGGDVRETVRRAFAS